MYEIITTIESLDQGKSKHESVSKKLLSIYNKNIKKKVILDKGVTTRK